MAASGIGEDQPTQVVCEEETLETRRRVGVRRRNVEMREKDETDHMVRWGRDLPCMNMCQEVRVLRPYVALKRKCATQNVRRSLCAGHVRGNVEETSRLVVENLVGRTRTPLGRVGGMSD
jgi:hypothetical protein